MRVVYFAILLLFVAAIVIFAAQNLERVTIKFLGGSWDLALAVIVAAVYLLGMFSGWSVVGMLRTSLKRVTERPAK